jgi:RND family efflux transporter MFP subunit
MNKTVGKWIMAAGTAAMLIGVAGCGKPSVTVTKATLSQVPLVVESTVTPEAAHSAPVIPMVSGAITSNVPDVGTKVKAGDVLFQIDSSRYEAQAEGLRAQIAAATAPTYVPVQQAPADDSMEASLLRQGIITRAEYNRIQGRNAQAAAPVQQSGGTAPEGLTASLQSLEKAIADCSIRAPIDGVIANVYVTNENKNAVAGKPAMVIRQDSPVAATLQLPSSVDEVIDRAKEKKTLTVSLSDGKNVWYGELNRQQAQKDNVTKDDFSIYKIQVDNPKGEIAIGKEYKVRIETGQDASCYVVPSKAIIKDNQVAVVTDENLIDMRTVTIAGTMDDKTIILSGLEEGDRVVNNPPAGIEIGMEVKVS